MTQGTGLLRRLRSSGEAFLSMKILACYTSLLKNGVNWPAVPSYLKTSYIQPSNATSAKLISHLWSLISTWRSLLSKCRGEIADAPPHKEVLRRRQARKYFAPR